MPQVHPMILENKIPSAVLGANVIKLFTAVINHHSTVMPSFCVIKLYYLGNCLGMAVSYSGILTLEKVGIKLPR
jgi:hypothetical protein